MLSALKRDTVAESPRRATSRHEENYFITGSSVVVDHGGYTVDEKGMRSLEKRERGGFSFLLAFYGEKEITHRAMV